MGKHKGTSGASGMGSDTNDAKRPMDSVNLAPLVVVKRKYKVK